MEFLEFDLFQNFLEKSNQTLKKSLKDKYLRKHPAISRFGTMGSPIPAKFFFGNSL
jgi:hypothetical protein